MYAYLSVCVWAGELLVSWLVGWMVGSMKRVWKKVYYCQHRKLNSVNDRKTACQRRRVANIMNSRVFVYELCAVVIDAVSNLMAVDNLISFAVVRMNEERDKGDIVSTLHLKYKPFFT